MHAKQQTATKKELAERYAHVGSGDTSRCTTVTQDIIAEKTVLIIFSPVLQTFIIAQTLSTGEKIKSLANLTCNINVAVNFSCSMSPKRPTWIEWDVKPCSIHPPQCFSTCCSSRQRISTCMEKLLTGKTVLHCSTQEKRGNSSLRG